jgi:hypothetical protein
MSDNLRVFKQYLCGCGILYLDSIMAGGYCADIMKRQSKPNYIDLRDFIQRTGTTESELGKKANICQSHVNMIKNGKRRPTPEVAAVLEAITGIPLRNLLSISEKKHGKRSRSRPADPPPSQSG